jgi:transcriptional regulator with XRE-family HTH domain
MAFSALPFVSGANDLQQVWGRLFGTFMQSAREKGGWSVEQTALLAGMDTAEWAAIEAGTHLPNSRHELEAMADALEMEFAAMAQVVCLCRQAWGFK